MKKTALFGGLAIALSITTAVGGVFTYKYFDLKGNGETNSGDKTSLTKSDISYACSCVINDFESEEDNTKIKYNTRSTNTTSFGIPSEDYTNLTNTYINDFYDQEDSSSFLNQYYEFMFRDIFEIAISQNYVADKKFKPIIDGEEKDFYAYVTVDDCIKLYKYGQSAGKNNTFIFVALDYDFENDGYSFVYYRNIGDGDISTFYVEKDNALIDENYDVRSFTRFSGIRTYEENKFDYLIDYDFVNKKVYSCWESGSGDICSRKTYLTSVNSDSKKFETLYNDVFEKFKGWDLKLNEYFK